MLLKGFDEIEGDAGVLMSIFDENVRECNPFTPEKLSKAVTKKLVHLKPPFEIYRPVNSENDVFIFVNVNDGSMYVVDPLLKFGDDIFIDGLKRLYVYRFETSEVMPMIAKKRHFISPEKFRKMHHKMSKST